ncbi:hypothetical protein LUZ60_002873 [Juncus effusus]|nr:hypothetical protein LUZ60_002873 [Juncus effusus]
MEIEELTQKLGGVSMKSEIGELERDAMRFSEVGRKKDFKFMDKVYGRWVNVLEGLELHTGVFDAMEQQKIVDFVYETQKLGRQGRLRDRTYSEPKKWMRGKGRVTIQFGCCYNYATDNKGRPPGIIRDEEVDPIPPLIKSMIRRLVRWRILPATCVPNSCIINLYDKDDCIPPHIDHHDFVRPFCTVSFLSECDILFGKELKTIGPGEFSGSTAIPLPVGSVLVLKGNGADVAKHCVPAVPSKRISITFRKMDDSKLPFRFLPDPDLQNIIPLGYNNNKSINSPKPQLFLTPQNKISNPNTNPREKQELLTPARQTFTQVVNKTYQNERFNNTFPRESRLVGVVRKVVGTVPSKPFDLGTDEFPPLG